VSGDECANLLRDAIRLNPSFAYALLALGRRLRDLGDPEGLKLIQRAVDILERDLLNHSIDREHCRTLVVAAQEIGKSDLSVSAQARLDSMLDSSVYDEDSLVVPVLGPQQLGRG
jgi:hypothetical protein